MNLSFNLASLRVSDHLVTSKESVLIPYPKATNSLGMSDVDVNDNVETSSGKGLLAKLSGGFPIGQANSFLSQ